jgi:hypothetical protein
MGFLDKLKDKAKEAKDKAVEVVDDHGPQIKDGIHKAGDFVDKKTKGKYTDKIAKGTSQAGAAVDKMHTTANDSDAPATPITPSTTPPATSTTTPLETPPPPPGSTTP